MAGSCGNGGRMWRTVVVYTSTVKYDIGMTRKALGAPAPQYLKVKNHLREGIASGHWVAGDLLPSEAELVGLFEVSRMTVNRALRELHQEGLIERLQGVGTFVAQLHRISSTLTVRDLHEEIAA